MSTAQLASTKDGVVSEHVETISVKEEIQVPEHVETISVKEEIQVPEHLETTSVREEMQVSEHAETTSVREEMQVSEHLETISVKEEIQVPEHVETTIVKEEITSNHMDVSNVKEAVVSEHVGKHSVGKSSGASTATATSHPTCTPNNTNTRNPQHSTTSKSDENMKNSLSQMFTQFLGGGSCMDKQASSGVGSENAGQKSEGVKSSYGAGKAYFGMVFVRPGETLPSSSASSGTSLRAGGNKASRPANQKKEANKAPPPVVSFPPTPEAKPVLSKEEYLVAWKNEKDAQVQKLKKLAYEVVALKTARPNAKDKLHSAANRVPVRIEFTTESISVFKSNNTYLCYVFVDRISVGSGRGLKIKDAKTNAYEAALQKILMPHIRVNKVDPESSELEASMEPFLSPPPEPSPVPLQKSTAKLPPSAAVAPPKTNAIKEISSQQKESNLESGCLKRRLDEQKPLEDFVIVEPLVPAPDCTPAHTLRRSADFNHMLLEYEYFFKGDAARCVVKIENNVLADVNGSSKMAAKNMAASKALQKLKDICWVIKTKKAVDSNNKICKEDMLNELYDQTDEVIGDDNVGNKLLRKMGWYGGGVGKHGSGIVEPVSLSNVLNREGLGLSAKKEITEDFKKQVKQVIENYAASGNQEDLVFSYEFRLDERQVIHDECRRLNLSSKCRGKGRKRYLCVSRKRTANELFDHVMVSGGETARYVLVPPGFDEDTESQLASKGAASSKSANKDGGKDKEDVKGSSDKNTGKGLLPTPGLLGEAPVPPLGMVNCPPAFNQGAPPGNPMRPFIGNRFDGPRPGGFIAAAPGVQNRMGQPRMENMRFLNGNGMNDEFDRGYGNGHRPWGSQNNDGGFQDFGGQDGNFDNEEMEFNEVDHFHNGNMGPSRVPAHGFRNNQNMGKQWGDQDKGCFQKYGNKHDGFQNQHGMRFGNLGNKQDMGNQWENWQNNECFEGESDYNSGFHNEGMHGSEFLGGGNDRGSQRGRGNKGNHRGGGNNQRRQWGERKNQGNQWGEGNNPGNQWGAENNEENQWAGGSNEGNQWGGGNNPGTLWGEGNNPGNQWGGGKSLGNEWVEGNNPGNQWGGGKSLGNEWVEGNNPGNQWGGGKSLGNEWVEGNNPGNQWGGGKSLGNEWVEGNNPGNQWGGGKSLGNEWSEGNNPGNQWGGNNQGNQWGVGNNPGNHWGGNNQGNQWGGVGNQWDGGNNQGNQWGEGNNLGNQWGGECNPGNQWSGGNNQPNQWGGGINQPNQWGGGINQPNQWGAGSSQANQWGMPANNECFQNVNDINGSFPNLNVGMNGRGFGETNNTFEEALGAGNNHDMEDKQKSGKDKSKHIHNENKRGHKMGLGNQGVGKGKGKMGMFPKGLCETEQIMNGGDDRAHPSEFGKPARKKRVKRENCSSGNEGHTQPFIGPAPRPVEGGGKGQSSGSHQKSEGPSQGQEAGTLR